MERPQSGQESLHIITTFAPIEAWQENSDIQIRIYDPTKLSKYGDVFQEIISNERLVIIDPSPSQQTNIIAELLILREKEITNPVHIVVDINETGGEYWLQRIRELQISQVFVHQLEDIGTIASVPSLLELIENDI